MKEELRKRVTHRFAERFGQRPEGVAFASGRVNLIGEHVDYNDGLVLPLPVQEGTAIGWSRTDGPLIVAVAADLEAEDRFDADSVAKNGPGDWTAYVRGMAALSRPRPQGLRLVIAGDLPRGSGLSSSASLCVALGRAFAEAAATISDPVELARTAQRTEHEYAGVACGIMDQMAIAAGKPGHAMLLDCRNLTWRHIAIPPDWAVAIIDSGVKRGLVDGEYNLRRDQCEAAAKAIGVNSLREATPEQLDAASLPEVQLKRACHVIQEIERVRTAAAAIERADLRAVGEIMRSGHASLRDKFEVSVPAVDTLVHALNEAIGPEGGARMTGAGFGGAAVALLHAKAIGELRQQFPRLQRAL